MKHHAALVPSRALTYLQLALLGSWGCSPAPSPSSPAIDPSSASGVEPASSGGAGGAGGAGGSGAAPSGPTLPFSVQLTEKAGASLPALHSYSSARSGRYVLLLGGRVGGLHGFGDSKDNFPRGTANTRAIVLDPAAGKVLGSVDLTEALPPELAGPLTATNQEFTQVGTDLYVVGGYGKDLTTSRNTTFGSLIRVDVHGLVDAIQKQAAIRPFFRAHPSADDRLKVTGGGLRQHAGVFYLVFGQDFTGDYSVQNRDYNRAGGQFQKYTEKVRVFTLNGDLSIQQLNQIDAGYDASLPYHRRDLNLVDVVHSDGTPGAVVYGGVFKAGQVAGHTAPIDLFFGDSVASASLTLNATFHQGLSHYDCAQVTVFDSVSKSSFTTLFGGISQYHYDAAQQALVLDQVDLARGVDGLPFIDTVSTIERAADGTYSQFIQPIQLPGLLGTDAQFLPSSTLSTGQMFENGVIQLAGLTGPTLVGHVLGGIEAFGPYSGLVAKPPSTQASGRLFEVHVTPGPASVLPLPALPTRATPYPPPTSH